MTHIVSIELANSHKILIVDPDKCFQHTKQIKTW